MVSARGPGACTSSRREGGMIAGWSPGGSHARHHGLHAANGAVWDSRLRTTASAISCATDFHGNKVDVFDTHFTKQTTSATVFAFVDLTLPAGYAPSALHLNTGAAGATQIYDIRAAERTATMIRPTAQVRPPDIFAPTRIRQPLSGTVVAERTPASCAGAGRFRTPDAG